MTSTEDLKKRRPHEPGFMDPSEITEEMQDPDYALKQLAKFNGGKFTVTCSRCHHCR